MLVILGMTTPASPDQPNCTQYLTRRSGRHSTDFRVVGNGGTGDEHRPDAQDGRLSTGDDHATAGTISHHSAQPAERRFRAQSGG